MEMQKTDIMRGVAGMYGVDRETVTAEIREAIHAAKQCENGFAQAFWSEMPESATELDVVLGLAKLLRTALPQ